MPSDARRRRLSAGLSKSPESNRQPGGRFSIGFGWNTKIEKPTLKLQSPIDLDCDGFVAEVRKVRGKKKPLSAAALANLRDEYARSIEPARALAAEALTLENEISNLVNEAYGLTPEEVALMWQTAPPRMPINRPHS